MNRTSRDDFKVKGEWFVPDNPNNKVRGVLTFIHDDDITLELDDFLVGGYNKLENLEIICGRADNGEPYTLYNCMEVAKVPMANLKQSRWSAMFILEGNIFYDLKCPLFDDCYLMFNNLEEWIGENGYKKKDFKSGKLEIEYEQPNDIDFNIDDETVGTFKFSYSMNDNNNFGKISIINNAQVRLSAKKAKFSFDNLLNKITVFQNFLIVGTFRQNYPKRVIFNIYDSDDYETSSQVYWVSKVKLANDKPKRAHDFLFSFQEIRNDFDTIIINWYSEQNHLEPVIMTLISSFKNLNLFHNFHFLEITYALETFHRRKRNNQKNMSEDDYDLLCREVLDSVVAKYKKFVEGRLEYGNEPSLRTRLKEIVEELDHELVDMIIGDIKKKDFISITVDTRNYYTHFNVKLEKRALKFPELYYHTERLKIILIWAIMTTIGFSSDEASRYIKSKKYSFFNHLID